MTTFFTSDLHFGQRIGDLVAWAREIESRYGALVDRDDPVVKGDVQ